MTESSRDAQTQQYGATEVGALAHLYRGEFYPSTFWRTRLDTTTNWAIVTHRRRAFGHLQLRSGAPWPIVLVSFLLAAFLLFETRRYQY